MEPILTAKEMCDPEVDHIGIMAYAAYFNRFKPIRSPAEKVVMDMQPKNCYIGIIVSVYMSYSDCCKFPAQVFPSLDVLYCISVLNKFVCVYWIRKNIFLIWKFGF